MEAACKKAGPEIFFPEGSPDVVEEQTNEALAICAKCVVQLECLEYALETNQASGIWGGYPEDDRRRLRKTWLAQRRRRNTQAE